MPKSSKKKANFEGKTSSKFAIVWQAPGQGNGRIAANMNTSIRGLRALVSVLLLGAGLSAYAACLDPVSEHITPPGLTGSGDINPADACGLPCQNCITPHLDGGDQSAGSGDIAMAS
jgi:hypothetical protein